YALCVGDGDRAASPSLPDTLDVLGCESSTAPDAHVEGPTELVPRICREPLPQGAGRHCELGRRLSEDKVAHRAVRTIRVWVMGHTPVSALPCAQTST